MHKSSIRTKIFLILSQSIVIAILDLLSPSLAAFITSLKSELTPETPRIPDFLFK